MSELRKDAVTGTWVIIDTERATRVRLVRPSERAQRRQNCIFCEGNEALTPPEIRAYGRSGHAPNSRGWRIRVVPHPEPALGVDGQLERSGEGGIYDKMTGIGAHEVVVLGPEHDREFADLDDEQAALAFHACQERLNDLHRDVRFRYVMAFINRGLRAGDRLEHPNIQIIATPVTPKRVREEFAGSRAYFEYKERCVFCDMIRQEVSRGQRIVDRNEHAIAFAPFASRFPFSVWILPTVHGHDFGQAPREVIQSAASLMKRVLRRLRLSLADADWNAMLHTSPNLAVTHPGYWKTIAQDYHWYIEIIPRIVSIAGFEWGTGFYINPVSPEDAAAFLQSVDPNEVRVECLSGSAA